MKITKKYPCNWEPGTQEIKNNVLNNNLLIKTHGVSQGNCLSVAFIVMVTVFLSTDAKRRTTLFSIMNSSTGNCYSAVFILIVTVKL